MGHNKTQNLQELIFNYVGLVNGVYPNPLNPQRKGDTVTVPALPGCISDGNTKEEAIENIKDAISGYIGASIGMENPFLWELLLDV